ncbi:MAG: hypothetical protein Q9M39_02575 [Sulfurovum sp.]|nr:hypothetical protein [Sulfurovum sp.]
MKLGFLKTDEKIQNIITLLRAESYAQAQRLITTYIETPTQDILQRSAQNKKKTVPQETAPEKAYPQEAQSTIDEFQLFITPDNNEKNVEIDINDYITDNLKLPTSKFPPKESHTSKGIEDINIHDFLSIVPVVENKIVPKVAKRIKPSDLSAFDSLLNINADDVLNDNIHIDISSNKPNKEDSFFAPQEQSTKKENPKSDITKDTFFDIKEIPLNEKRNEKRNEKKKEKVIKDKHVEKIIMPESVVSPSIFPENEEPLKEILPSSSLTGYISPIEYKPMPYVVQKFKNMNTEYLSVYNSCIPFTSSSILLAKIAQEHYKEKEIEETLDYVRELIQDKQFREATQLVLVCASTESAFAQFILAREVYKGTLFTQNIAQAFTIFNTLAMNDYPEALCDLGQLYEKGIGTKKDKKRAEHLYKDAMEFGIKRAKIHFDRINKKKKGFFR